MSKELMEARSLFTDKLMSEIRKWIVGYDKEIRQIMICLLSGGPELRAHVLLEGVPGLAKTKLAQAIARTIDGDFKRIQGTPDLLPADITGIQIWDVNKCGFETKKGPIFANIVLIDEVNRIPPRTQSGVLEAMQEGSVTLGDVTYQLPEPFMVLATQNPIEHDGTFPLPAAQADRFMMKIRINYASERDEMTIVGMGNEARSEISKVLGINELLGIRSLIRKEVMIDKRQQEYIVKLVRATRPESLELSTKVIDYGASPRAMIALEAASRVHAFLRGEDNVLPDDVDEVALPILRHRIIVNHAIRPLDSDTNDYVDDLIQKKIANIGKEFRS